MNSICGFIICAILSFAITWALGYVFIPWLHKLKFGQTILDIGPNWHKKKQGTPTMGGIMFIIACVVSIVIVFVTDRLLGGDIIGGNNAIEEAVMKTKFWAGLMMALGFGLVGFADDYIKVAKKRNQGLTISQKSVAQIIICVGYLLSLQLAGATKMFIPFVGNIVLNPVVFWILGFCILYAFINAVNFTDGIDGLCSSVTLTTAVSFIVIAVMRKYFGAGLMASALLGGCAGFLVWNRNPAKVFMGDTGSMFMGGLVIALAYIVDCPLILIPVGIIYVIEIMSDVIQIGYFKITHGKRVFKMAPIHHHFEMSGWKENKIVVVFSIINIIGGIIGILLMNTAK